jgi:hypothetical protein
MPNARPATLSDLDSLLELFEHVPVSRHVTPMEAARAIWARTLAQEQLRRGSDHGKFKKIMDNLCILRLLSGLWVDFQ